MTQNINFKTISSETQNYDLFQINPLKKYYILWFYLFKPADECMVQHLYPTFISALPSKP